jgi:hypothetical protein
MILGSWFVALAPIAVSATGVRVEGTVLGPDGNSSAGAQVFLGSPVFLPPFGSTLEARGECDSRGEFALEVPQSWIDLDSGKRLILWAWKPGSAIAAAMFEAAELPVGQHVELRLGAPARSPLDVVDPDGKPVAGARVRP